MAILRAIPRSSVALILSALMLSVSIIFAAVYAARGDHLDQTFYGCLYAGSLSQVNTSGPPVNCGRGTQVEWNAQGIQGLPGTDGIDGVSGYQVVINRVTIPVSGTVYEPDLPCPEPKVPLGGGAIFTGATDNYDNLHNLGSAPYRFVFDDYVEVGWRVAVKNDAPNPISFTQYVVCAFMAPDPAP